MKQLIPHFRTGTALTALALGAAVLVGCTTGGTDADGETATRTVTEDMTATHTEAPHEEASGPGPDPATDTWVGIPGGRFVDLIGQVPETDPAPYASSLIFPAQPGLQFQGPDGTYCEMYAEEDPTAMCSHEGEGDINAVSVHQGEPATTHNVNRIFVPHERTRVLEPGMRLVEGPVSCAVPEGEVRVMCAVDFYSFAVSREGVELS